jgi:hypothetical protein
MLEAAEEDLEVRDGSIGVRGDPNARDLADRREGVA